MSIDFQSYQVDWIQTNNKLFILCPIFVKLETDARFRRLACMQYVVCSSTLGGWRRGGVCPVSSARDY